MRYIIANEPLSEDLLYRYISRHYPLLRFSGKAGTLKFTYELILRESPDIVFLNTGMNENSLSELLSLFPRPGFKIILVALRSPYAGAASYPVFDYLFQPVRIERPVQSVQVQEKIFFGEIFTENNDRALSRLYLNQRTKLEYVELENIIYLEGDGNYTYINTTMGKTGYTAKTLKKYDEILCLENSGFVRVHKSFILNVRFVESVMRKNTELVLLLKTGEQMKVSRRKTNEVIEKLRSSGVDALSESM